MNNKMEKRLILTTFLTTIYGYAVFGRIFKTPPNTALYGDWWDANVNCSSTLGSSNISWYFVPVGESTNYTISTGSVVNPAFTHLYWIDQPTGYASNLIIRYPNGSTTGTFTCADSEMAAHAQLLIRYGFPFSTNASDNLFVDDVISVSCSLIYFGNPFFTPIFRLYKINGFSTFEVLDIIASPQLNVTTYQTTATATFYLTVPCITYLYLYCEEIFGQPEGNLLPGSATNAPSQTSGIGYVQSTVSCVPTEKNLRIAGAISGGTIYFGGMLTCDVPSNPPATYSWTDITYGNTSIGTGLTIWHGGSYQCNATNYLNGRWYSASKIVYNLTVERLYTTATPLYGPIDGGTNVTMILSNWSKQVTNISAVYLGEILRITDLESDRLNNSFMMITSNATTAELIGQPLPITIEFVPGPYNISTNLSFTYQDNSEVTDSPTTFAATDETSESVTEFPIYFHPEIKSTKATLNFDPNKEDFISIKGKHMTSGVSLKDYLVKVGAEVCENIYLTDHQLRCRPPKQKPQPIPGERNICDPLLSVDVTIGSMYYHYACLKYSG